MIQVFAEYEDAAALARAIDAARAWGPVDVEAYTPYFVPEIERALAPRPSRFVAITVLVVGLSAAAGAYALQWYLNAYDYPLDAGGRPPHMPLAYVPITFEMGVLFASFAAIISVLIRGRLMRLWYPSCEVTGIESSTGWRFWLEISPLDATADIDSLVGVVEQTHPLALQRLEVT